jgi:tetratricopeptide (TPR) repeat protein
MRCRLFLIVVCVLALVSGACSRHRSVAVTPRKTADQNVDQSSSPASLSDYIRGVLKISGENTVVSEEALKQLHQRRPELADLAARIAERPRDLESRHLLATAYVEERLFGPALHLFQEVRALSPASSRAEAGIANIWREWGDYSLALRHAQRAVALDPRSVEALELLGRIHLRANEIDRALSAFLTALELAPDNPSLLNNAGYVLLARGDLAAARTHLERAVSLSGFPVEARNNLGIVLARMGDREGALQQFLAANQPAAAFNNLGVVYLEQRKWYEAREAFRRALALDPNHSKARANLVEAERYLPPPAIVNLSDIVGRQSEPTRAKPVDPPAKTKAIEAAALASSKAAARASGRNARIVVAYRDALARIVVAYRDALARFRANRYREAIEIFNWVLEQPDHTLSANCEYWIGESYFGLADYKLAHAAFKRVMLYEGSTKRNDALVMMKRTLARQRQASRGPKA